MRRNVFETHMQFRFRTYIYISDTPALASWFPAFCTRARDDHLLILLYISSILNRKRLFENE